MAIEFRCSQCNQLLRVPEDAAGKNARCPKCQALMTVPGASAPPTGELPLSAEPGGQSTAPPSGPFAPLPSMSDRPAFASGGAAIPPKPAAENPFGSDVGTDSPGPSGTINPYASPAATAYGYAPQFEVGGRPGLPWENRGRSFSTWWETTKLCLMQPSYAYGVMRQYGGLGEPMLFSGVGLAVGTFGQMLWYVPLMVLITAAGGQGQAGGGEIAAIAGIQVVTQLISSVFGVLLGATLGLIIGAAISHVCLMAVGGAKQSYETTLRVIGYAQGSTAWMNVIPGGGLVAFVWLFVLEIVGFSKAHDIDMGKSALAVFLPMIVCCGCFTVIGIGIAIAASTGAFR